MLIYTDGGCKDNGKMKNGEHAGTGSWSFVVAEDTEQNIVKYQKVMNTTNNRTELMAIIQAVKYAKEHCDNSEEVTIVTDSGLCFKGWNWWIDKWIANGWKTNGRKPVKNQDLWKELHTLAFHRPFVLKHCRGHNKDGDSQNAYWNSIADTLCTASMAQYEDTDVHEYKWVRETGDLIPIEGGKHGVNSGTGC